MCCASSIFSLFGSLRSAAAASFASSAATGLTAWRASSGLRKSNGFFCNDGSPFFFAWLTIAPSPTRARIGSPRPDNLGETDEFPPNSDSPRAMDGTGSRAGSIPPGSGAKSSNFHVFCRRFRRRGDPTAARPRAQGCAAIATHRQCRRRAQNAPRRGGRRSTGQSRPGPGLAFGKSPDGGRTMPPCSLACKSHQLSTASADGHASPGRTPSSVLDILSSMPAGASVRAAWIHTPLHALATKPGEICRLASCGPSRRRCAPPQGERILPVLFGKPFVLRSSGRSVSKHARSSIEVTRLLR